MDLLGLKAAIQEIEKEISPATAQLFNRLDLSVQQAVANIDDLATKHEAIAANFLDGFEVVISFRRKGQQ